MSSTNTRLTTNETLDHLSDVLNNFKAGSLKYDAFNRFRVSTPTTLFESKQIVSEQNLLWHTAQVAGVGGTFTYSRPRASTTINLPGGAAGRYVRRTRRYFNYQPGKGQLVLMSAILGAPQADIHKRIGYFDDDNGVFFEVNSVSLCCCIRSSVTGVAVDTRVRQEDWNIDKLDGTGISGLTIDTSLPQIYWFDFEWLGVGRVRYGIFYNGVPVPIHEFNHANIAGISSVYMSTPALPMQAELENDGAGEASSLEQICSAVISEGGDRITGVARSVSRGDTPLVNSTDNLVPAISVRARDGFEFQTINILDISIMNTANHFFRWALILNPTFTVAGTPTWVPVGSSTVEFTIGRTATNVITGGLFIDEGYVSAQVRQETTRTNSFLGLGKRLFLADPKDEFCLAVQRIGGGGAGNYYAALQYEETT